MGDAAPQQGDILVFGGTGTTTHNDFAAGTTFQTIEFAAGGFTLTGNSITLADGICVDDGASGSTVSLDAVVLGGSVQVDVANGESLTLSSALSGNGSLTKTGVGQLILGGANTYGGGTTIDGGTLSLGSTAGLGAAGNSIEINNAAVLDLNGYSPTVGTVVLTDGSIVSSGGPGHADREQLRRYERRDRC